MENSQPLEVAADVRRLRRKVPDPASRPLPAEPGTLTETCLMPKPCAGNHNTREQTLLDQDLPPWRRPRRTPHDREVQLERLRHRHPQSPHGRGKGTSGTHPDRRLCAAGAARGIRSSTRLCRRRRSHQAATGSTRGKEGLLDELHRLHEQGREPEQGPRPVHGGSAHQPRGSGQAVHPRQWECPRPSLAFRSGCGRRRRLPFRDAALLSGSRTQCFPRCSSGPTQRPTPLDFREGNPGGRDGHARWIRGPRR